MACPSLNSSSKWVQDFGHFRSCFLFVCFFGLVWFVFLLEKGVLLFYKNLKDVFTMVKDLFWQAIWVKNTIYTKEPVSPVLWDTPWFLSCFLHASRRPGTVPGATEMLTKGLQATESWEVGLISSLFMLQNSKGLEAPRQKTVVTYINRRHNWCDIGNFIADYQN